MTASVKSEKIAAVALIYGGIAPQLVQTEAPSSLIRELGDFEVSVVRVCVL